MLIGFLLIWIISALGLWLVTLLLSGVRTRSFGDLLLAAMVLGIFNATIRPLLWLLTLPLTVLTFGLFTLLVNALIINSGSSSLKFTLYKLCEAWQLRFCGCMTGIAACSYFQIKNHPCHRLQDQAVDISDHEHAFSHTKLLPQDT